MSSLLDSEWFRLACYGAAVLIAIVAFGAERLTLGRAECPGLWPTFWVLQAMLLAAMGTAMAVDAADTLTDLARARARSEQWYLDRRSLQFPVVAAIATVWMVSTVLAIWRVPPRRRRYLPSAALIGTLVSFAAVRTVSLHQVDTLLYRYAVGGVRLVAVVEISVLTTVFVATVVAISQTGVYAPDRPAE